MEPHWALAPTGETIWQVFVMPLHARPRRVSQLGAVAFFESHGAPFVATAAWQVPDVVPTAPTHSKSAAHGAVVALQGAFNAAGVTQALAPLQMRFAPHEVVAHESPACGGAAHVPQLVFGPVLQYALAHCPEKPQGAPLASVPTGGPQSAGVFTPNTKSLHAQVVPCSAAMHRSTRSGLPPVAAAERPFKQSCFSRASHVAGSV
jgi:hypothetical protein